ncbi:MAG TPA: methyltransferase domain-containing protein [Solirubrobacteraceae bacterium]|jgi:sterol 24-C-methyltransferase|nr:methyltransferase domain-containing protein [Solirubrobacteraceae bacterium]
MSRLSDPAGSDPSLHRPTQDALSWYLAQYATGVQQATSPADQHARSRQLVNAYYDLVGDFYERGWGESFHFAAPSRGERYADAMRRYERVIAERLHVEAHSAILDIGCGIGGPARNVATVTGSHVTGLNINAGQVARARELTTAAGLTGQCDYVHGDFMDMPFADQSFDGAYHVDAICHAPRPAGVYDEILRVLKPGAMFVSSEWCLLDDFDLSDSEHSAVRFDIEACNAISVLRTASEVDDALAFAGFVVEQSLDSARLGDPRSPWYRELTPGLTNVVRLRMYRPLQILLRGLLVALAAAGRLPDDSAKINDLLARGAKGLVRGGELGIFTPMWLTIARKP